RRGALLDRRRCDLRGPDLGRRADDQLDDPEAHGLLAALVAGGVGGRRGDAVAALGELLGADAPAEGDRVGAGLAAAPQGALGRVEGAALAGPALGEALGALLAALALALDLEADLGGLRQREPDLRALGRLLLACADRRGLRADAERRRGGLQ